MQYSYQLSVDKCHPSQSFERCYLQTNTNISDSRKNAETSRSDEIIGQQWKHANKIMLS
ncbi:hypothetical protein MtrunA17_Chr2g0327331 [Medicago truncatula]|uniref:Uncharacterized protein n=1 Tax=Medicago truncatula TaxID=3880 RepID=A0A396JFG4_MEDTR|nr:hypothetical protein MtrunA17_Chr2g0327331 [Medicago truncatula]